MIKLPRLVLDTNIVVSAMLWKGRPDRILALAESGEVRLHTSRALLGELSDTLGRAKFAKRIAGTACSTAQLVFIYRQLAHLTRPVTLDRGYSRDPDDDRVIACAVAARADFIVTGDDDLLVLKSVEGVRILRVAEVLGELV